MSALDQSRQISMSAPLEKKRRPKYLGELEIMSGLAQKRLLVLSWELSMLLAMCRWSARKSLGNFTVSPP